MTLRNSEAREISQALLCKGGAPMMMVRKIRCFCQSKSIHNCVIASSLEWVGRPENRFLSSIQLDSEKLKTRNSFLSQISKLAGSAIQLETLQYRCIPYYNSCPLLDKSLEESQKRDIYIYRLRGGWGYGVPKK